MFDHFKGIQNIFFLCKIIVVEKCQIELHKDFEPNVSKNPSSLIVCNISFFCFRLSFATFLSTNNSQLRYERNEVSCLMLPKIVNKFVCNILTVKILDKFLLPGELRLFKTCNLTRFPKVITYI